MSSTTRTTSIPTTTGSGTTAKATAVAAIAATAAPSSVLTGRDIEVLLDLYKHRYLSVSQIRQLHFPSLQTAYRRLRALSALGHIKGFLAPHVTEHVYYLAPAGAELVASALDVEASDLKWTQTTRAPKDYYFLRHFLAVNDFRIALTQGCLTRPELRLLGFIPEYYAERAGQQSQRRGGGEEGAAVVAKYIKDFVCDTGAGGGVGGNRVGKLSHTPDAVFALEKHHRPALFFLEIDRGTEVVGNEDKGVLKCARFYLNYLVEGGYQRYQQDFSCEEFRGFRTLIVTTSEVRSQHIREAITQLEFTDKAKQFIWVTSAHGAQLAADAVFDPIWRSGDARDANLYRVG